jgi:hypothetical protein
MRAQLQMKQRREASNGQRSAVECAPDAASLPRQRPPAAQTRPSKDRMEALTARLAAVEALRDELRAAAEEVLACACACVCLHACRFWHAWFARLRALTRVYHARPGGRCR